MIQEKEHKSVVFSCEVFPPKRDDDIYQIYKTLDEIKTLKPDFISVTYGAGGSNRKAWRIFWHCVVISREQCHRRNLTSAILSMQRI